MKRNILTILLVLTIAIQACRSGYETPNKVDPNAFNLEIARGIQANEECTKTPKGIVKELLPKSLHDEENSFYKVEEKRSSDKASKITVTEEGAIDDEVNGERTTFEFRFIEGKWMITEMTHSVQRHN